MSELRKKYEDEKHIRYQKHQEQMKKKEEDILKVLVIDFNKISHRKEMNYKNNKK
jgi:hypothetical protein